MLTTQEWWSVVFVANSDAPEEAVKTWRKTMIGRGHPLKAKEFDNAVSGNLKAGGYDQTELAKSLISKGIPPTFVVPEGHEWTDTERSIIALCKMRDTPVAVLQYDAETMVRVPPPVTSPTDLLRLGWRHEW